MTNVTNIKKLHQALSQYSPDVHLTQQEASEALNNLTGFMSLLVKINKREKIISFDKVESEGVHD